jgi:predicted aminopeptidase
MVSGRMTRLLVIPVAGAVFFLICAAWLYDLPYILVQGSSFLEILGTARKTDTLRHIEDSGTAAFFDEVEEIRRFATEELGLQRSRNFTRYVETEQDYLAYVVSGVREDRFERKYWRYPVVGPLFYKGFFDRNSAAEEAARLSKQGYDTIIRTVDAFSTLGYFRDPLYSFMQRYTRHRLASLIIHEEVHATVFLRGRNMFNEEIATFIGEEGGLLYLQRRYGKDSGEYRSAVHARRDRTVFMESVRQLHAELNALYTESDSLPRVEILKHKARIIREFQERYRHSYDTRFTTDTYRFLGEIEINNAYLDLFVSYGGDLSLYRSLLDHLGGNLPALVALIRRSPEHRDNPRGYLEEVIRTTSPSSDTEDG